MAKPVPYHKGDIIKTKFCGDCKVVHYENSFNVTVKFLRTKYVKIVEAGQLRKGIVYDPYYPRVCGIGVVGEGKFSQSKSRKLYILWQNMLKRCYDLTYQKRQPTYIGCTVVKRWHNFQNFCEDIIRMPNWNKKGFDLDKDLRVLGNKKYGPKYCSFVPREINRAFTLFKIEITKKKDRYYARWKGDRVGFSTENQARVWKQNKIKEEISELLMEYKGKLHIEVIKHLEERMI